MQNVKQIWKETAKRLEKVYDSRESENIAYLLLEDIFKFSKADIMADIEAKISFESLDSLIERLLDHEPIQYVTGVADFFGRQFSVAPGVLIPRPETEELCDLIIKENQEVHPKVIDVGVGSGCLAITLSLELDTQVIGIDISDEAVAISSMNAEKLKSKVQVVCMDILNKELPEDDLDILVSNPPYIPEDDRNEMLENVLRHEPEVALFVPNDDPILFYKAIAKRGLKSLKNGGKLYFEIHERKGKEIESMLKSLGYTGVMVHQDMQGKDRMVSAINSTNK